MELQPYNGIQTGGFLSNGLPTQSNQLGIRTTPYGYPQPLGGMNQQMWGAFSQMLSMVQSVMTGMMQIFQGMLKQQTGILPQAPGLPTGTTTPTPAQPESEKSSTFEGLKDFGQGLLDIGKDILGGGLDSVVSFGSKLFKGIKSLF